MTTIRKIEDKFILTNDEGIEVELQRCDEGKKGWEPTLSLDIPENHTGTKLCNIAALEKRLAKNNGVWELKAKGERSTTSKGTTKMTEAEKAIKMLEKLGMPIPEELIEKAEAEKTEVEAKKVESKKAKQISKAIKTMCDAAKVMGVDSVTVSGHTYDVDTYEEVNFDDLDLEDLGELDD